MIPGLGGPLEKGMATHSSILPRRFHGQRILAGISSWGCKELDMIHIQSTFVELSLLLEALILSGAVVQTLQRGDTGTRFREVKSESRSVASDSL